MYLPSLVSGKSCWRYHLCSQETLVHWRWNLLGSELAGGNRHHKTLMIPADGVAQVSLQTGKIVEIAAINSLGREDEQWGTGANQNNGFGFIPNLLSISCCSSREEKRILGLRPLVGKPSQGGLLVLGWSLGSTSMFKFTWNRSGYFSCMSQASKSYLAGETAGGKMSLRTVTSSGQKDFAPK